MGPCEGGCIFLEEHWLGMTGKNYAGDHRGLCLKHHSMRTRWMGGVRWRRGQMLTAENITKKIARIGNLLAVHAPKACWHCSLVTHFAVKRNSTHDPTLEPKPLKILAARSQRTGSKQTNS